MTKDETSLVARLYAERDKHRSNSMGGPPANHGERLFLTPLGRLLNDAADCLARVEALADEMKARVDSHIQDLPEDEDEQGMVYQWIGITGSWESKLRAALKGE